MEADPFAGHDVREDGLRDEHMTERVPVRVGDQQILTAGLADRRDQLPRLNSYYRLQQLVVGAMPGESDGLEHPLGRGRQPAYPHQQNVAQGLRQPIRVGAGCDQLLGQKGVAAGTGENAGREGRIRLGMQDPRELGGGRGPVQPRECDPVRARAAQLGEQRAQRTRWRQLVVPIGAHEQQATAAHAPDEDAQQTLGRGVGPVQILHDQHGQLVGEPFEQQPKLRTQPLLAGLLLAHRLVDTGLGDARPRGAVGGELRHEQGQPLGAGTGQFAEARSPDVGDDGAQDVEDRCVGEETVGQRQAVAGPDLGPLVAGALGEFMHESGLAHAGLADDEECLRCTPGRPRQCGSQLPELVVTCDQLRTGQPPGHATIIPCRIPHETIVIPYEAEVPNRPALNSGKGTRRHIVVRAYVVGVITDTRTLDAMDGSTSTRARARVATAVADGGLLAVACLVSYWLTTSILSSIHSLSEADDVLGGLWAVIATIFVIRQSYDQSIAAALTRILATFVSFAICLLYLAFLPFHPVAMAALIGLSSLAVVLIGRPGDSVTAAIATAIVMVSAAVSPHDAWQLPVLRLADSLVGVAIGIAAAWIALRLVGRLRHTKRDES